MTLSTEHIQQLFDFIRRKYVHFYDLQSEIVDHLAAAIEDKMSGNKKLLLNRHWTKCTEILEFLVLHML